MTYHEIKKLLIRLKSRKYLVNECTICLCPIENNSKCRMLNCYHIFHSECVEKWFIHNLTCPNCKKRFGKGVNKKYNYDEFLATINVDNECFYSDHLIRTKYKLASTQAIRKHDPYYI